MDTPAVAGGIPVRPRERFLTFGAPALGQPEMDGIADCIRRRWVGTGPITSKFERAFAEYKRAPHAVALNSCSAALYLAMLARGIGPGDEVITTTMTFCATANASGLTGAKPVLADCDAATMNITAESIEAGITPDTKAIIVVHLAGRCCDMDPILRVGREHGLFVIEDCAHAIESTYHGIPAGLLGDVGCFSFYATKNITSIEGGMLVTRDAELADEVRLLANHGMNATTWRRYSDSGYRHYAVERLGFKFTMPDVNAAVGLAQLARIEDRARRRIELWHRYDERLTGLPCRLPAAEEPNTHHARHLYSPLLDLNRLKVSRDDVLEAMTAESIGVGVHYIPVHHHPYYATGTEVESLPNAAEVGLRTISLPLTPTMTDEDVDDVCRAFSRILRFYS